MDTAAAFPEIGKTVKCTVIKASFGHAMLKITEVENQKTLIEYKAIMKTAEFSEGNYICDKLKSGDIIDCIVVAYSDSGICVSQI
ncbi:hypothetical protein ENBRE01_0072 [Enteropsectra breve]|nr:hypothetical protein ENBRE01_0072 [Enteropsectra breve]